MDRPLDLSSRYGRGDGINANKDRQGIYGHTEPTFDVRGMISTGKSLSTGYIEYQKSDYARLDGPKRKRGGGNQKKLNTYCAESIDTWEVYTVNGIAPIAKAVGVDISSVKRSLRNKCIVCRFFFYELGSRPSEDEIDDMLDAFERAIAMRVAKLNKGRRS